MKRVFAYLLRAVVVLFVVITALFAIRFIQTVQAASQDNAGRDSYLANAAYPSLDVSIAGTGTGAEVVVSSPGGIDCGTKCSALFPPSTAMKLVAGTSSPDVIFQQWIVDGQLDTTNSLLSFTINQPKSVIAIFNFRSQPKKVLTVSKVGTKTGTVTGDKGGIDCGKNCAALFDTDETVVLTGNPATGEMVEKWVVNGMDAGYSNTLSLTLNHDQNVMAFFGPERYRLNVYKTGRGDVTSAPAGINCGTTCLNGLFDFNATVTLYAHTYPSSSFLGWDLGGGAPVMDNPLTITMTSDKTVTANFTPLISLPLMLRQ